MDMVENEAAKGRPADARLELAQTDRVLLDLLRDGIAERSAIRNARGEARAQRPEDTKRARLEHTQQRLETILEEALGIPTINRALRDRDFDIPALREAGERGAWREVVTAINVVRPTAERQAEDQRRAAIAEATRAIVETRDGGQANDRGRWIEALEEQVRGSVGGKDPADAEAAKRLLEWAEAALSVVPEPVAIGARVALVDHAYGRREVGPDDQRSPIQVALRVLLKEDDSGRYTHPSHGEAETREQARRPRELNRIWADEGGATPHGERQVEELADASRPAEPTAEQGLFGRLRGYFRARQEAASPLRDVVGEDDGIPESLRRRYAIHVSDDRKTIELFEAGAKAPAITLDAKSISTPHDEGVVIADIIVLARDRGWQSLKVAGSAEFKDAVWFEASKAGLVAQHEPSSAVKAALAKWEAERPQNEIQQAPSSPSQATSAGKDLARAFAEKSPEERLADPRLRNAQLELMVGIRTAEKELKRPIAEMPDVAKALTAAVRQQLESGRAFDAPFVKPSPPKPVLREVAKPKIDPDMASWPRL